MKKTFFILIAAVCLIISQSVYAAGITIQYDGKTVEYTDSPMTVTVNNKSIDMPLMPIVFNGRALVPVREVFEAMGASVYYDAAKKQIDVSGVGTSVSITINSNKAYVNGTPTSIPDGLTPKLINKVGESAKTMVPIRFLSESLGMIVNYDDSTRNIAITTAGSSKITGITHSALSENQYYIKLTADTRFENISHSIMTNPLRLVIDMPGLSNDLTTYTVSSNKNISQIRFGYDSSRSRMVIDLDSIYSYKITATKDNSLLISILTAKSSNEVNVSANDILETYEATPNIISSKPADSNASVPAGKPVSQNEKIVVIDAGHGGSDSGAIGKLNAGTEYEQTIYEKDLTLDIAKKVKQNLESAGVSVKMTRDDDSYPTLEERANFANTLNAAMFVSIHINSNEKPEPLGTETYYCTTNNGDSHAVTSQQIASDIQTGLISSLGSKDRGVKTANFYVIKQTSMPAVLIELGFISNEEELNKMNSDDYRAKAAKAISDAVIKNLNNIILPGNV